MISVENKQKKIIDGVKSAKLAFKLILKSPQLLKKSHFLTVRRIFKGV